MIVLFSGSDTERARRAAREYTAKCRAKEPDLSFERIVPDSFSEARIPEWVLGQGLFVRKTLYILDGVFEDENARALLLKASDELRASENVFVAIVRSEEAAKELARVAAKAYAYDEKRTARGMPERDPWALMNAVRARDAKAAWATFTRERTLGTPVELLSGSVHSALRSAVEKGNRNYPDAASVSEAFADRYHQALSGATDLSLDEEVELFLIRM